MNISYLSSLCHRWRVCVQLGPSPADLQKRANIIAIKEWHETASRDAKRAFPPKRRWDPTLLAQEGKWLDAKDMYRVVDAEIREGALECSPYE